MFYTLSLFVAFLVGTTMAKSNSRMLLQGQGGVPIVNPVNFGGVPPQNNNNVPSTTYPPLPTTPVLTEELVCDLPQTLPGTCALTTHTPQNLANNFKLMCATPGGCYGSTFNLFYGKYGVTPAGAQGPTDLEGLWFTEPNAGAYATVNLYNFFDANTLKVNHIECVDPNACYNLKLNLYNVDIGNMLCDPLDACTGCSVTDWSNPNAPVTTPCLDLV